MYQDESRAMALKYSSSSTHMRVDGPPGVLIVEEFPDHGTVGGMPGNTPAPLLGRHGIRPLGLQSLFLHTYHPEQEYCHPGAVPLAMAWRHVWLTSPGR
jgi:hypothetical protein